MFINIDFGWRADCQSVYCVLYTVSQFTINWLSFNRMTENLIFFFACLQFYYDCDDEGVARLGFFIVRVFCFIKPVCFVLFIQV